MAQQYADDAFLVGLYPEAADVAPEQRARWLAFARGVVHLSTFEGIADDAHASMTMHLLALQPGSPVADEQVTSMSLGSGSISFDAGVAVSDEGLEATKANDKTRVGHVVVEPFRQREPMQDGLEKVVICTSGHGATLVRQPYSMVRMDGVGQS